MSLSLPTSVFEMGSLTKYGVDQVIVCLTNETQGFVSTHSPVLGLQVHTTMLGFCFFNADGSSPQVLMLVQQELY